MAGMVISSRTPEGEPAACPVCGEVVWIEPSLYFYDAPCPRCGQLLWFLRLGSQNILLRPGDEALAKGILKSVAEFSGVDELELQRNPDYFERLDLDSLDLVELVLEFEEEFCC